MPMEVRSGAPGSPYAVRTLLGWTLNGPLGSTPKCQRASVNFVHADTCLEQQVRQFWELEGGHLVSDEKALSVNDQKVIECWNESSKLIDGHYEMAIPFKVRPVILPNNRSVAERRLNLLRRRLMTDPIKFEAYQRSIEEMIDKGYAVKVPQNELQRSDGAVWYLPHHSVTSEHKPGKLRVVFDCAAKFRNVSLNEHILQGPDLTNKLIGVLMRFRQDSIALIADIESMFLQVRVSPEDRDVLRFLWWPRGDLCQEPEEYRMTAHLFGGVWSPSCANYALRRTAEDNGAEFGEEIAGCVQRSFYVDDFLKSVGSQQEASHLVKALTELLGRGGFHLTKWISNDREVIQTIPESERAKVVKGLDLTCDRLPSERALGLIWDVETDTFGFSTVVKDKPATRRGILSIVSSVYDPLGFLCPSILPAKIIVQELCRRNIGWDETIPPDLLTGWLSWLDHLSKVEELKVKRCVKPPETSDREFSVHHFCDASEVGYGVASYLRSSDSTGNYSCSLLMAKSRLAPIKTITIPRLELSAAALAVKVDKLIRVELDVKLCYSCFWTDSTIVLSYIKNTDKRFQTFVANRVSVIHEGSNPSQWRHVRSELNPADDVSRGLTFEELVNNQRWLHGPNFLMDDESSWPELPELNVDSTQLETKSSANSCAVIGGKTPECTLDRLFQRYSSFYKLLKSVAWLLRVKDIWRSQCGDKSTCSSRMPVDKLQGLSVEELHRAEEAVLQYVQWQSFGEENSTQRMKCLNNLQKLDPFLSKSGLLCVGGRLVNAALTDSMKHQIILPKRHPVVSLIIRSCHASTNHSGKEFTLAKVREKYWIISARVSVRNELRNCYECRRQFARPGLQKMSDLPPERVTPGKPPFSYVGVDYFGPFLVKQGRSVVKRYGCLFTCLTIRAVHIEIAHSLDTDSFINALQRFICRRNRPDIIRSDNGTNFVGAERELSTALQQWNQTRITEFLRQKEICWKFNTPTASHMGGVWERMIRSVRKVLASIVKEQLLTDEVLLTVMCEAEATVNSRPMTSVSDDPNDLNPITPNHLLLLRVCPPIPPGEFVQRETYRRHWKQAQYLADIFWRRWLHEYLPALQYRHRWQVPKRNFKVNDVVIIMDDSLPRNSWSLGRIVEVFPGNDGLVRSVRIKTSTNILTRPVTKICLLETSD